ncbi:MAG: ComF family protein [Acidimicrobiia bacterium]
MMCLVCARPAERLCRGCQTSLRPSAARLVGGVVAVSAFAHEGTAARLIHNLKYRRSLAAGRMLADAMAEHLHRKRAILVPLPRALSRRVVYGIDPAVVLAGELARRTGLPVVNAVDAPMWWRRRAGRPRRDRTGVSFRLRTDPGSHLVLVDDVLTSGATAASAIEVIGRTDISILTATSAGTM